MVRPMVRSSTVQRNAPQTPGRPGVAAAATWRTATSLVLSLAGLGVSVYLTIAHYSSAAILACPENSTFDCARVTTSAQSVILGVPVAVLGLAFYVVMTVINLPRAWRMADRRVHVARLVLSGAGVLFVIYLISAELLVIKAVCLWCSTVHLITFLLFVLVANTVPSMLGWGSGE